MEVGEHAYVNSGVLFWNDTPAAHRSASLWHQKWLCAVEKCANHRDQPALNAALFYVQPRLNILPHKFNAQFKIAPGVAENALIWHFYPVRFTYPSWEGPLTSFEVLVEQVFCGEFRRDTVSEMINRRDPWNCEFSARQKDGCGLDP